MKGDKHTSIRTFVMRALWIAGLPFVLCVFIYAMVDPFHVLRNQDILVEMDDDNYEEPHISVNKGFLSLLALDQRRDEGDIPDSFIFGASISCYYEVEYWQKLINSVIMPQHFDSANEGAGSMRMKIEYLKNNGYNLNNALIVLDPNTLQYTLTSPHLWSQDHPRIAGWWTWPRWHYNYIKAFYDFRFLAGYLPVVTNIGTISKTRVRIFEPQPMVYDSYRNEESIPAWDMEIRLRPELYYSYRNFPDCRVPHCSNDRRIDRSHEKEYRRIAQLLKETDYHVIVSPTIQCDTLSTRDSELLASIFGRERFHDFSSSMAQVALNDSNWYDRVHYRAPVARALMDKVYKSEE